MLAPRRTRQPFHQSALRAPSAATNRYAEARPRGRRSPRPWRLDPAHLLAHQPYDSIAIASGPVHPVLAHPGPAPRAIGRYTRATTSSARASDAPLPHVPLLRRHRAVQCRRGITPKLSGAGLDRYFALAKTYTAPHPLQHLVGRADAAHGRTRSTRMLSGATLSLRRARATCTTELSAALVLRAVTRTQTACGPSIE